jgi:hypothetical protein
VSFDIAIHSNKEGGKKRRKQRPQGTTTTINHDNGNNGVAGGSGVRHILTTVHSDKRQGRPPTYHFKRLLMEACPNHAYPSGISSKTAA